MLWRTVVRRLISREARWRPETADDATSIVTGLLGLVGPRLKRKSKKTKRDANRLNREAQEEIEGLFRAAVIEAENTLRRTVPVRTGKMKRHVTRQGGDIAYVLSTVRYAPYVVRYKAALRGCSD